MSWFSRRPGRIAEIAVAAVWLAFLIWANVMTPLSGDDYCRVIPVSLVDSFALAWRDYFIWTGRLIVTAITYFVVSSGRSWSLLPFDIFNALIFVALIRNVTEFSRMATGSEFVGPLRSAVDTVFVALMLWWVPRDIAEVALWKTGAIGYLWAVTGELWVMRLMLSDQNNVWAALFAFVIATFLEPLSLLVSVLLVAWCVMRRKRRQPAPTWLTAGHALGTIVLFAAPGNFVRADTMVSSSFLDRIQGVFGNLGSLFDGYFAAAVAVVLLAYAFSEKWPAINVGRGCLFLILMLVYMASLLGLPRASLAARVSFPASMFVVCFLAAAFMRRPESDIRDRVLAVSLLILFGCHLALVLPDLVRVARVHRDWANEVQSRGAPDADVTLPAVRINGRTLYVHKDIFFEGFTSDPEYFVNRCYAEASHVKSITAK